MSARNRKPESRRENGLQRLVKDFKGGIASLGSAIERLLQYRTFSGGTVLVEPKKVIERETLKTVTVPQVLEREILTARQAAAKAPSHQQSKRVLPDYATHAKKAVASGVPQFLAGMLKAEAALRPAAGAALRPAKGNAVEALMKVAKSIKAGRLPFVPKETRRRAQELLNAIYGKRTGRPATWRDKETAQLIGKHRLIPLATNTTENFRHSVANIPLVPPLPHHKPPKERILSEQEARSLESVMPRFRDEGVASGPKIIDSGESTMHADSSTVVYRDNSTHVAGAESPQMPTSSASIRPAAAARYRSPLPTPRPAAAAPSSPEHKPPPMAVDDKASNQTRGGLGSQTGGGTAGAGGGPMKIEGELRIPGMSDWVAKVEGTLKSG